MSGNETQEDKITGTAGGATARPAAQKVRERLARTMLRTVVQHGLIEDGDRILVAISGGKDSYTLLDLLSGARRKSPVAFELLAFHLDQGQPGYDGTELRRWLADFGVPFEIHREDTYTTVKLQAAEGGTSFCAPCSRLRRGILYTAAERTGCNRIALGHHRDDALETLLLNLFFAGKLQAMPARYRTNDGRFDVIRPLVECAEEDIACHARAAGYPLVPCNLCGSQDGLKRVAVRRIISRLEEEIPNVRDVMLAALRNVRPSHLLDREVAEAWVAQEDNYAPRR